MKLNIFILPEDQRKKVDVPGWGLHLKKALKKQNLTKKSIVVTMVDGQRANEMVVVSLSAVMVTYTVAVIR